MSKQKSHHKKMRGRKNAANNFTRTIKTFACGAAAMWIFMTLQPAKVIDGSALPAADQIIIAADIGKIPAPKGTAKSFDDAAELTEEGYNTEDRLALTDLIKKAIGG